MIDYIKETIESYIEYISKVEFGSKFIAELLREDRIAEALTNIVNFSEGMDWIIKATVLLKENNISIPMEEAEISGFLEEINSGLEIADYLSVADIFEYEIAEYFSKLSNELQVS